MTAETDLLYDPGSLLGSRDDACTAWPPSVGRLANHLGWLAREAWPPSPKLMPGALGAAIAEATRRHVTIHQPEASWAVRDAVAALRRGLRTLGIEATEYANADYSPDSALRFTVCAADAIERVAETCPQRPTHCTVISGVPRAKDMALSLPHLGRLASAASCDPAMVKLLQAAGTPAMLWSPLMDGRIPTSDITDPLIKGIPRSARIPASRTEIWAERPLDIVDIGPESSIRSDFLAAGAERLAQRPCVLVQRRELWRLPEEPILAEQTARYLFLRTKIVLNLDEREASALDWSLGAIDAMASGAVVISTPCFPHPFLIEGIHYLEETPERILPLIDWLLDAPEGRRTAEAVAAAGASVVASEASPSVTAARLLQLALGAPKL